MNNKKMVVEGHRGYRPMENSFAGFQKAFEMGVNGIETDIWLSKENFLFIYHGHTELGLCHLYDCSISKTDIKFAKDITNDDLTKYVDNLTKRKLIKLEDLLVLASNYPHVYLNLEFKDQSAEAMKAMGELLTRMKPKNKIFFSSFCHDVKERLEEQTKNYPILESIPFGFCCHNLTLLDSIQKNLGIFSF
jgi:glycerophosphoryl diester phosphodiesterase